MKGVRLMEGTIIAISTSSRKGVKKENQESAYLVTNHGLLGDAHAGQWHRQVSLLAEESIAKITGLGIDVGPGDFAENITTAGVKLVALKPGDRVLLGQDVELEITQIGKTCHSRCNIYQQVGDCVMPREGVFGIVLSEGRISAGDGIRVICQRSAATASGFQ
jgi:MOSC domain-containing protein YiiM